MTQKKLIIFMPSIEGGGVEKNLFLISNYLAKNLPGTILITSSKKYKKKFKNLKIIYPKINVENFESRKLKYFFCIFELIKLLICNNNYILFSFQANLYCALIGIFFPKLKIITRSNSSPSGWSNNILKKIIFYFLFKRINKVIVNSLNFKNELKKKFNVNSICIYNPLNKDEIIKLSKKKKYFNFFNTKYLKIINIGRLVDQKDHYTFLKSLKYLKNKIKFRALIIGNGIRKTQLVAYINNNRLGECVRIINFQTNPYPFIKKSDLMVHTAKFEGLPNVLLEALSLKKHVISTNCPTGPSEILLNGKAGDLVKIGDSKEISKKIISFSKNKSFKKVNYGFKNLKRFELRKNLDFYLAVVNNFFK